MEAQRTFLAIALCILVIVGWNFLTPILYPQPPQQVQTNATGETAGQAAGVKTAADSGANATTSGQDGAPDAIMSDDNAAGAAPAAPADLGQTINVHTPLMDVAISPQGGVIKELQLLKFNEKLGSDSKVKLIDFASGITSCLGAYINGRASWTEGGWTGSAPENTSLTGEESATLTFSGMFQGLRITRELTFKADSYLITEKIRVQNPGAAAQSVKLSYALGVPNLSVEKEKYNAVKLAHLSTGNSFSTISDTADLEKEGVKAPESRWGTVQNNYFLAAVIPGSEDVTFLGRLENNIYRIRLEEAPATVTPGGSQDYTVSYYMGPKEYSPLHAAPADLSKTMDYGWFGFISGPMVWFLNILYGAVGNYGIAIILMTIVVKALFWPLSQKSYKSMERMRKIQPFIKQVQEKYKDDKQEMQREIMRLYKAYKVNPASGCLPILIQIPVFIGLYQGLLNAVELRHASFITHLPFTDKFWLADLSAADPFYITPLIMGASMFLQQKMSPQPGDPTQAKIMMFMPAIFIVLFINFPSGLVVYWLVNNIISIVQQYFTRYRIEKAQAKAESGKAEKA